MKAVLRGTAAPETVGAISPLMLNCCQLFGNGRGEKRVKDVSTTKWLGLRGNDEGVSKLLHSGIQRVSNRMVTAALCKGEKGNKVQYGRGGEGGTAHLRRK